MTALHTRASVALVPATTLWGTTLVSAQRNTCKSTVATTAWVRSVMMGEPSSCGKSTRVWEGLLGVSKPWKSVERHVCGRREGGWVYLRCWYAAVSKAAGLRDPGLPCMVVQVVHCPRKAKCEGHPHVCWGEVTPVISKWICEWVPISLALFLWCLLPASFTPTQLQTWGRVSASGTITVHVGMSWPLTWPGRRAAVLTTLARPGIDPARPAQLLPAVSVPPWPSFQLGPF